MVEVTALPPNPPYRPIFSHFRPRSLGDFQGAKYVMNSHVLSCHSCARANGTEYKQYEMQCKKGQIVAQGLPDTLPTCAHILGLHRFMLY